MMAATRESDADIESTLEFGEGSVDAGEVAVIGEDDGGSVAAGGGAGGSPAANGVAPFRINVGDTRTVCGSDGKKQYTEYEVVSHNGARQWVVWRRYSDFCELHELIAEHPLVGALPPKRILKFKATVIAQRRRDLDLYIQPLSALVSTSGDLREFLGLDGWGESDTTRLRGHSVSSREDTVGDE